MIGGFSRAHFAKMSSVSTASFVISVRSIIRSARKRARFAACIINCRPKQKQSSFAACEAHFYDMILDIRNGSPTFGKSFGAELSAENRRMMYVPKGFAHGFLTLADDTEAFYFVDEFYAPDYERCIRYNDPKFALEWPAAPTVISDKDRNQSDFDPVWHLEA